MPRLSEILGADPSDRIRDTGPARPERQRKTSGRLSEVTRLSNVVPVTEDQLSAIFNVPEATKVEMRKLGPVTFAEGFAEGASDLAIFGSKFVPGDFGKGLEFEAENAVLTLNAMNRIQDDDYTKDEQGQFNDDRERVQKYVLKMVELQERGHTFGGQVGEGVGFLPELALSFMLTGGVASPAKLAVQRSILTALKKFTGKVISQQALSKTKKLGIVVAGTLVSGAVRTALLPHMTVNNAARRQINSSLVMTDKGVGLLREAQEKPFTSLYLGLGETFIDMFTEELGGHFLPRGLKSSIEKMFGRLHPQGRLKDLWTATGYSNFLGELGEEQLANLLKGATGVQDYGAADPNSMWDRITSSIFSWEELAVTASVLAVPGVGRAGTAAAVNFLTQEKKKVGWVEPPPTKELTEAELDEIQRIEFQREQDISEEIKQNKDRIMGVEEDKLPVITVPKGEEGGPQILVEKEDIPLETPTVEAERPKKKAPQKKGPSEKELQEQFEAVVERVTKPKKEEVSTEQLLVEAGVDVQTLIAEAKTPKEKVDARRKVVKLLVTGRLKKVAEEQAPQEKLLRDLLDQRNKLKEKERLNKSEQSQLDFLDKRVGETFEKLDEIDFEIQGLQTLASPFITNEFTQQIITTNTEIFNAVEAIQTELESITAEKVTKAVRGTKKSIKETQKKLIELIEKSRLDPADRGKFTKRVSRTQSAEQLEKAMPALLESMQRLIDRAEEKQLRRNIVKTLRSGRSRIVRGRTTAKLANPFVQQEMDFLEKAAKLNQRDAAEKMAEISEKLNTPEVRLSKEQRFDLFLELATLSRAGGFKVTGKNIKKGIEGHKMSIGQLRDLNLHITAMRVDGRISRGVVLAERKIKSIEELAAAQHTLSGESMETLYLDWAELERERLNIQLEAETTEEELKEISEKITVLVNEIKAKQFSQTRKPESGLNSKSAQSIYTGFFWGNSFPTMIDILSAQDTESKQRRSKLSKLSRVIIHVDKKDKADKADNGKLGRVFASAYGFDIFAEGVEGTLNKAWTRMIETRKAYVHSQNMQILIDRGSIEDAQGNKVSVRASTEDLIGLYLTLNDSGTGPQILDGNRPFVLNGTRIFGMSEEMQDEFFGSGKNALTEQDLTYAKQLQEAIQEFGIELREKVMEEDGVVMPLVEQYWPRSTVNDKTEDFTSLFVNHFGGTTILTSAQKQRTDSTNPILIRGATETINRYVNQKNHYIHMSGILRTVEGIFKDPLIQANIVNRNGQAALNTLDKYLETFRRGSIARNSELGQVIDGIRSNFQVSVLSGFKAPNLAKQLISYVAMKQNMPEGSTWLEFHGFVLEFLKNPKHVINVLGETGFLQTRQGTRDINVFDAHNAEGLVRKIVKRIGSEGVQRWANNLRIGPNEINLLMLHIHLGDVGAIYSGGWAVYQSWKAKFKSEGMTEEQAHEAALDEFIVSGQSTQQSSAMTEQTPFATENSLTRTMAAFGTTLNQYLQLYQSAWRNRAAGRMSGKDFVETMVLFHVILPNLFLGITSIVSDDDDEVTAAEHAWATAFGPFGGAWALGRLFEAMGKRLFNWAFGTKAKVYPWKSVIPMESMFSDALTGDPKRIWEKTIGPATGLPLKRIDDFFEGGSDIMDGDLLDGFLEALGYTPSQVKDIKKQRKEARESLSDHPADRIGK